MPFEDEVSRDERVSLYGFDPEQILRALLAVDLDSDPIQEERSNDGKPESVE